MRNEHRNMRPSVSCVCLSVRGWAEEWCAIAPVCTGISLFCVFTGKNCCKNITLLHWEVNWCMLQVSVSTKSISALLYCLYQEANFLVSHVVALDRFDCNSVIGSVCYTYGNQWRPIKYRVYGHIVSCHPICMYLWKSQLTYDYFFSQWCQGPSC